MMDVILYQSEGSYHYTGNVKMFNLKVFNRSRAISMETVNGKRKQLSFLLLIPCIFLCFCTSRNTLENNAGLEPIQRLLEGNKRYIESNPAHPHQSIGRMKEISEAQHPFAVVVSCSDSRVPPEIIFDQGLGDLFVIRTAGNVIGEYELASVEYAIMKLQCKIIVIVGHEKCGAIQSFIEQPIDSLSGHLNSLINFLRSEPNSLNILKYSKNKSYHTIIHNIIYGIKLLKDESKIIRNKIESRELEIYGTIYHMDTGKIQIIEEVVKK